MKTALITGSSGFSASHLVARLRREDPLRVIGVDWLTPTQSICAVDERFRLDLGEGDKVKRLVKKIKPNLIFHLAGIQHGEAKDVYRTNVLGTIHLLEAVRKECPSAGILIIGSAAEYGLVNSCELPVVETTPCRAQGAYGLSKQVSTMIGLDYARCAGLKVVVARPFNIIGVGMPESLFAGAILARARMALNHSGEAVIKVGNLESQRDFIAVEDAVDAYVRMISGCFWGEIFNICSGHPLKMGDLAKMLLSHSSRPIRLETNPALVREGEVNVIYGSGEKARRAFGFVPSVGVKETAKRMWYSSLAGKPL